MLLMSPVRPGKPMSASRIVPACCLAGLLALTAGHPARAQSPPRTFVSRSQGGGNQMMSPVVFASWITGRQGSEPEQLQLLVLWRGTPGWFLRPGGSKVSSAGSGAGSHTTIVQGGVTLTLDFDPEARVATIHGKRLELGEDNVVLVDEVDSSAGPRVSGRLRVDRAMPGSAGQIGGVLKKSPEIISFLKCDTPVADLPGKAMLERMCLTNIGIIPK